MYAIRSIQQLESLRGEWNALADGLGHALFRHEWFACAASALHEECALMVVAVRRGGELAAVAPLVRRKLHGIDRLEFIGASRLHEPAGFLCRDADARGELLDRVLGLGQPLMLQRIAEEGSCAPASQAPARRGWLLARSGTPSLAMMLDETGRQFLERPPSKLRYDVKRARTRAAERGAVACEAFAPGPDILEPLFDAFLQVEAAGWKGRRRSALAANERMRAFFGSYARRAAEAGTLRMFTLRVGDTIAAAQIAVEIYERLWILKIGYDESFARCSPGLLLTAEALRYASDRGLKSYEFLGAAESWEARWHPTTRTCTRLVYYPWSVRGCLGASFDVASAAWSRFNGAATAGPD